MSYRGDGYPVLLVDGTANAFPYPLQGSRSETLVEEDSKIVTRRNGERVHLSRRFRFRASYEWVNLTEAQLELLIAWRNSWPRIQVVVRPHNDVTTLQVPCWLEELDDQPGLAGVTSYRARATFIGIDYFVGSMIPSEAVVVAQEHELIAHLGA